MATPVRADAACGPRATKAEVPTPSVAIPKPSASAKSTPIKSPETKRAKAVPSSKQAEVQRSLSKELKEAGNAGETKANSGSKSENSNNDMTADPWLEI